MNITVTHRYYFEELLGSAAEAGLFQTHRIISVNSVRQPEDPPFSKTFWARPNLLLLRFDDVEDPAFAPSGSRYMDEADAEAVARFVAADDLRPIIVHCTAGISRSGAIGTALNEYYNRKIANNEAEYAAFVRKHPHLNPNLLVMKLLWKHLGLEAPSSCEG
jgi:predicted protein tyrosine phosphatase